MGRHSMDYVPDPTPPWSSRIESSPIAWPPSGSIAPPGSPIDPGVPGAPDAPGYPEGPGFPGTPGYPSPTEPSPTDPSPTDPDITPAEPDPLPDNAFTADAPETPAHYGTWFAADEQAS